MGQRSLVASGVDGTFYRIEGIEWLADDAYDLDALVVRCDEEPSWIEYNSHYLNTEFKIVVALRRHNLVAIHTDISSLKDSVQSWLNTSPQPPYRKINEGVMHAAFIRGTPKGYGFVVRMLDARRRRIVRI